ncbi:choice-of-anchor Q domain-containing protein, partial [Thiotrichales bacterium HSG1]|nr:choice-of-anchor Q domain-containing protein [Thiotrichales bacterium HSG1]
MTITRLISTFILLLALLSNSYSATITVNNFIDNTISDATCTLREAMENAQGASHEDCVAGTNGLDEIDFNLTTDTTVNLTGELSAISNDVNIVNPTSHNLTVRRDTGGDYRIFTINSGVTVELEGLNIENGVANNIPNEDGGGIYNSGILTIKNCQISQNKSVTDDAGGIYNVGSLTIVDSIITDNQAVDKGGAIYNETGDLIINNTTISNNSGRRGGGIFNNSQLNIYNSKIISNLAEIEGAGIYNNKISQLDINSSTVSENKIYVSNGRTIFNTGQGAGIFNYNILNIVSSSISENSIINSTNSGTSTSIDVGMGAGIYDDGTLAITNSIISGNIIDSKGSGAGIYNYSGNAKIISSTITNNSILFTVGVGGGLCNDGTAIVENTIIAGNNAPIAPNYPISPDVVGYNIIGDNNNLIGDLGELSYLGNSTIGTGSDIVTSISSLCPLQNNGGNTKTHAFLPTSPAIDAGNDTLVPNSLENYQRGYSRKVGTVDI